MKKMVCIAVLLLAFAIPVRLSANGSNGDCYPGNGVLIASGATSAKGEAYGTAVGITTDRHTNEAFATPRGSATVGIEFEAKITGPNDTANNGVSTGRAELKIHWLDTTKTEGITDTVFESGCVAEIETSPNNGVGEFEGEYEGSVKNFPGYPGTTKAAVLSIQVLEDSSDRLRLVIGIDLGYTSFENVYAGDDISLNMVLGNQPKDEFKITNVAHGRASCPDTPNSGSGCF